MAAETIYIAGPMRGYPRFNFDAFDEDAKKWRDKGWSVISPAEMDRNAGFNPDSEDEITQDMKRQFMRRDLTSILERCDAIALLPGWENSQGVKVEKALAEFLGLEIYDATGRLVDSAGPCHNAAKPTDQEGDRQKFSTGAVRSPDANGTRYDLISHIGLRRIAETYAEGAIKYDDNNWLKGFPASDVMNHCIKHIYQWLSGDGSEDHLAHATWNLITVMHFEEARPELIDCYHRQERREPAND